MRMIRHTKIMFLPLSQCQVYLMIGGLALDRYLYGIVGTIIEEIGASAKDTVYSNKAEFGLQEQEDEVR